METYQIQMKIEIVPCHHAPTCEPVTQKDGSVYFTLSEGDAMNIDRCEHALLQTVYPTLRDTLSKHLSDVSKKKAHEQLTEGTVVVNEWPYRVDGEVGRFEFTTHQVLSDEFIQYDTAKDVFPPCRCWEQYKTLGFKEVSFIYGATETSYPKTARLLNRIRHQPGATPATTLRDGVRQEGTKILEHLEDKTTAILRREGFTEDGRPVKTSGVYQHDAVTISPEEITRAIVACDLSAEEQAEVEQNPVLYEQAVNSVNISLDDVVVKKQKAERTRHESANDACEEHEAHTTPSQADTRKYVHNTVAHIQHGEKSYTISGQSVVGVLRVILGFLLQNVLLTSRLQFFVDGQKPLQAAIWRAFSWFTNIGLILDWYHLEDKCKRQLSLGMKGTARRNEVLGELTRMLWYGMVERAMTYLEGLKDEDMKNSDAVRVLIGYIERNRPYIPCYEVRKRLGLRNSSNIGEKMNDLLVSARQKHNGMSWSPNGSATLAALEAIKRNEEYHLWFEYGEVTLKWAASHRVGRVGIPENYRSTRAL